MLTYISYSTGSTAWGIGDQAPTDAPSYLSSNTCRLDSGPSHSCPSHTWVKTFNLYNATVGVNFQEKQKAGKQSLTSSQRTTW